MLSLPPYVFAREDLSKYSGHKEIDMHNRKIAKGALIIDVKLNKSLVNELNIKFKFIKYTLLMRIV